MNSELRGRENVIGMLIEAQDKEGRILERGQSCIRLDKKVFLAFMIPK